MAQQSSSRSTCRPPYLPILSLSKGCGGNCRAIPRSAAFSWRSTAASWSANFTPIREIVRTLGGPGIGISIDNLGAECSSLLGLEGCPIAELKARAAVVQGCADNRPEARSVRDHSGYRAAPGSCARSPKEWRPRADLATVREIGFDLVQGFLFGKPMTARKFARLLRFSIQPYRAAFRSEGEASRQDKPALSHVEPAPP